MRSMMTSHATTKHAMEGRTAPVLSQKLVFRVLLQCFETRLYIHLIIDSRTAREKLCAFELEARGEIDPWGYKNVASGPQRIEESCRLDIESTSFQYESAALGRKIATNGRRLDQTVHDKY